MHRAEQTAAALLSCSLPLHHCCSVASKLSTAPSLASGWFPNSPTSVPSSGIFLLPASCWRLTLRTPRPSDGGLSYASSFSLLTRFHLPRSNNPLKFFIETGDWRVADCSDGTFSFPSSPVHKPVYYVCQACRAVVSARRGTIASRCGPVCCFRRLVPLLSFWPGPASCCSGQGTSNGRIEPAALWGKADPDLGKAPYRLRGKPSHPSGRTADENDVCPRTLRLPVQLRRTHISNLTSRK